MLKCKRELPNRFLHYKSTRCAGMILEMGQPKKNHKTHDSGEILAANEITAKSHNMRIQIKKLLFQNQPEYER